MKQAQGITEQLKVDNALEWVGRMNNIQACAREIVDKEIIYQQVMGWWRASWKQLAFRFTIKLFSV